MMMKTHLVISAAAALFLLPHVNDKIIFLPIVLFATSLPDIDSMHSELGHRWYFRPLQFFLKHRGVMHSFTFCILVALAFSFYIPVLALPFFLGYSSHLIADSFTIDGIRPFWPLSGEVEGKIRTGGVIEEGIYYSFILVSFILLLALFL